MILRSLRHQMTVFIHTYEKTHVCNLPDGDTSSVSGVREEFQRMHECTSLASGQDPPRAGAGGLRIKSGRGEGPPTRF